MHKLFKSNDKILSTLLKNITVIKDQNLTEFDDEPQTSSFMVKLGNVSMHLKVHNQGLQIILSFDPVVLLCMRAFLKVLALHESLEAVLNDYAKVVCELLACSVTVLKIYQKKKL